MALDAKTDSRSISRRTIIKGAAWSAPVMIAAVAVPAAVASDPVTSVLPAAVSFAGPASQTVNLTLSPTPTTGGTITLALSGPYVFASGATTASATVTEGGAISVSIAATGVGNGTLSLSGTSSGVSWQGVTVQLTATALVPTSSNPSSVQVTNSSPTTYNFTLSPTPFTGTEVTATLIGSGWTFDANGGPTSKTLLVAAGGVVSPVLRHGGNAASSATLRFSGASWGPVDVTLSR